MQAIPKNNNLFCPSFNAKKAITKGILKTKEFINKIDSMCSNIEKFGSECISLQQEFNVSPYRFPPVGYH